MIELQSLRSPAWRQVVRELSRPAQDDRAFLIRLASVLGQVTSARSATLWLVESGAAEGGDAGEPRPLYRWPQAPVAENDAGAIEEARAGRESARHAALGDEVRVFGEDTRDGMYDAERGGYVIAVPIARMGEGGASGPAFVVTMAFEARSRQAIGATLAIIELVAGYVHQHAAQQRLARTAQASAALDLAARLIAGINESRSFKGAAMRLCNELARNLSMDRVALGWVRGPHGRSEMRGSGRQMDGAESGETGVRCVAMSDTEHLDRRMAMVQKLEHAMEECFDQEQPVLFPPPAARADEGEAEDVLLSQAIVHAHRELSGGDASVRIASVPMRAGDEIVGVLTLEGRGQDRGESGGMGVRGVELVQAAMDLVSPMLRLRRSDDRALPVRAWDATLKGGAWAVGPKHTAWKLGGVAAACALGFAALVKVPYRIEAPVELRPRTERVVSVPFDGIVREAGAGVEPGAKVEAGQLLVRLDTSELELSLLEAKGAILQADKQADEALRQSKQAEAQQARARGDQARARAALLEDRIARSRILAPIDGTIIAGEIKDRVGATLKLGEPLFRVAPLDDIIVVARVSDSDIAMIEAGGSGEVATKAHPGRKFPMHVERIVPLAQAEEGANAFEVRAAMEGSAAWMRPGMEGVAKFDTGKRTLIEIGSRRIVDTLRLWLWW
ncbi:MAG: efflux RND transporter periplasmic adaptor subunit [Phycisphaerales bacterium]|nr:efflux RND transporter periplasmic adaptor subunit [Phycisphaerales bacterium]